MSAPRSYDGALLCPTCRDDASSGDEVQTERCADCLIEACVHELRQSRRTELNGRSAIAVTCRHFSGCARRQEGRSVSSQEHDDEEKSARADHDHDVAIDEALMRRGS